MKLKENFLIGYKKAPGRPLEHLLVANELKELQDEVGGYIEVYTLKKNVVVICNEEGRLLGMPENCRVFGVPFVGTLLFLGTKGDEFGSCPIGMKELEEWLEERI